MFNKKGEISFGKIVAIIGSILIACGVAWFISQNWANISAPIKIIILLMAVSGAYFGGFQLRLKRYGGIAKALFVLGSLLYTLSIFLIAQIFATSSSLQGTAWLLLLAWTGVIIAAYTIDSSPNLVIGLIEFIIWIILQFLAFSKEESSIPGMLAICFLALGVLFYSLNVFHRAKKHNFVGLYLWWTSFYFLAFSYILSFQKLIPILWTWPENKISTNIIIFIVIISIISVLSFIISIIKAKKDKILKNKEILGVIIVIIFLGLFIASTSLIIPGECSLKKTCNDYNDRFSCQKGYASWPVDPPVNCIWEDRKCAQPNYCGPYRDKVSCERISEILKCQWSDNKECTEVLPRCTDKSSCQNDPICKWMDDGAEGYCNFKPCEDYTNKELCLSVPSAYMLCSWYKGQCIEEDCSNYETQGECDNIPSKVNCRWKWEIDRCIEKVPCEGYSNNKLFCISHKECEWNSIDDINYFDLFENDNGSFPLSHWVLWIFANIVLLAVILAVIGLGTWYKRKSIINLGIIFFALDILTRYIGFIMDFWGYTSLSIIFITGGILLLLGGWIVERWRRKLINQVK